MSTKLRARIKAAEHEILKRYPRPVFVIWSDEVEDCERPDCTLVGQEHLHLPDGTTWTVEELQRQHPHAIFIRVEFASPPLPGDTASAEATR